MEFRTSQRTSTEVRRGRTTRDSSASVPSSLRLRFLPAALACLASLQLVAGCAPAGSGGGPVRAVLGALGTPAAGAAPGEVRRADTGTPPTDAAVPDPSHVFGALSAHGLALDSALGARTGSVVGVAHARSMAAESPYFAPVPDPRPGTPARPWDGFFCNQRPSGRIDMQHGEVYSTRTAYWMAWLSLQGYRSRKAEGDLRKAGFTRMNVIDDRSTGLLGYVASTPDFTVVSFSGSADVKDWIHDLTFDQIEDEAWGFPGRFHHGFQKAINGRWASILYEVEWQSRGRPVYVTGHSLGGAMAFIAAARLADAGLPVAGVYTFAAPRVGDDAFAARYEELIGNRTWRFNNNEDIIPHLGPSAVSAPEFSMLFLGKARDFMRDFFLDARYQHVGTLLRFDARGAVGVPEPEDLALERAYWRTIYDRSDGKNILEKLILNWRLAGDHLPAANFCYLTRG